MKLVLSCMAAVWLCLSAAVLAADTGKLLRQAELREKPFNDARVLAVLKADTPLTITQRKSSWAQVVVDKQQGWVKVLNIISVSGRQGSSGLLEVTRALTSGSSGRDSSAAVKGVNEESLKKAAPAPGELKYLDTLGVSKAEAEAYARKAKLKEQEVPFLPAPQ